METNLSLVSPKPVLGLGYSPNPRNFSTKQSLGIPLLPRKPTRPVLSSVSKSRTVLFAFSNSNSGRRLVHDPKDNGKRSNWVAVFASTSTSNKSSSELETTSIGVSPQPYPSPPPSQFGSPLFWIGVGVGLSALFSFVASRFQKYATQQLFKTMMGQMASQNNQFSNGAFSPGSPFPFPPPSTSGPSTSTGFPYQPPSTTGPAWPSTSTGSASSSGPVQAASSSAPASETTVTVDVSSTKVTAEPVGVKDEAEVKSEAKQPAFVDVSAKEPLLESPFENFVDSSSPNGAASKEATTSQEGAAADWSQSIRKPGSVLSVEALEKMMEDPTVQKMVYPHLPEEMRNPATFKWMLQNPVYRQQLQEMLDKMGGSTEWDSRMIDTLKNFDFNSPDVKQQFDQLGLTPEEVISKIMANPDLAMAFQNPRVQQAIMDCSQNPMNIAKYQDDKEVMDVFSKISQLFPGTSGPGGF
uniref:Protein TIC 40, chloroplastic n=2 Tax=Magnoliopsida TaxID=3398 RepID=A0A7C8YGE9_OPUST